MFFVVVVVGFLGGKGWRNSEIQDGGLKADLHGTTLSHAMCSRQVYDTSCFV